MKKILFVAVLLIMHSCTGNTDNTSANKKDSGKTATAEKHKKVIVFFGNSITAGYGLENKDAFTTLIQLRLDSLGNGYEVVNAGVSGETTAAGASRVAWVVERQPVDVFVLELGANDGLRGVPVTETISNLESIIDQVRKAHPEAKIILAGMMVPPSMGPEYSSAFKKVFPEVAKNKNVTLIPFVLNNVAGIDSLNQADGIHPNPAGEKIVMENIWEVLKEYI
jgi:acyl-CoA thioesterase I